MAALSNFFRSAIENVARFGDTDIFPFPVENLVLRDEADEVTILLDKMYSDFANELVRNAPRHVHALAPVGLTGFRWATQLDPIWNVFLLGVTLSVSPELEKERISPEERIVFSYRVNSEVQNGAIFRDDVSWRDFLDHSIELAKDSDFVVICDIADCYQRIPHHRLENALEHALAGDKKYKIIMGLLSNFSDTKSYGLPVGGSAARILVETLLGMSDRIFRSNGIRFVRYADDYHIFVSTLSDAYNRLRFVSEKLARNDGLTLQKSKTRVMTSSEFIAAQSLLVSPDPEDINSDLKHLFSLKLRYDPYSKGDPNQEYELLKVELNRIDILGLLNRELVKTRVHGAVTRRIVAAIQHLQPEQKEHAVLTLVRNMDVLYPILPVVLVAVKKCFSEMRPAARSEVCDVVRAKVMDRHFVTANEIHAAYALRVLAEEKSAENLDAVAELYSRFSSPIVRRDVIIAMARWRQFAWLDDLKSEFQSFGPWERRSFIIASFFMGDAGHHWRRVTKKSLRPFELIVMKWAEQKTKDPNWTIPL